ncbi:glyoxalase [Streptomonospora sp. PA3]|uniref:VOC family protein n=1 Tax=Streptomonospora sp. PA3 TaxID=2607326 RepID=UPI0012DF6C2D|nr:VOC family protein [Streptomonospora sp. PA3]MUL44103.1 glyoxalase [Streptomonospora sp. PA3]
MTAAFSAVGIVAADMGASLEFYRRIGVDIPDGSDGLPHVEAKLPGGLRIMWDTEETVKSFAPDWQRAPGGGVALAFDCGSAEGVDRLYAELTAVGYTGHREPWNAVWGQRYAVILDPDGNWVDLFAPLE